MNIARIALYVGIGLCGAAGLFMAWSKLSPRKTTIITLLMGLTGLSLMILYPFYLMPHFGPAFDISQVGFFQGPQGNTMLIFNSGGASGRESSLRLNVLNAETGEVLGKEILGFTFRSDNDNNRKLTITEDKVWLEDYDHGLHARDPYTGVIVLTKEDILKKYPQLTSFKKTEVKTEDGYVYQVKPPDFNLEIVTFPAPPSIYKDTTRFPFRLNYDNVDLNAWVDDKIKMLLASNDKEDPEVMQLMQRVRQNDDKSDYCINENLKLRKGFLINNSGFPKPYYSAKRDKINNSGFTNPTSFLIGHREITSGRTRKFVVSRVDLKGNVLWNIHEEVLGGEPKLYYTHRGTLYMTIEGRVMAFDPITGIKKWERQL